MFGKKNKSIGEELPYEKNIGSSEDDSFSLLNQLLDDNFEFKTSFDTLFGILGDGSSGEDEIEVECIEIDGHDYIIAKKIEIAETTYVLLVNKDDATDLFIQKVIVEDGEEYLTSLDSDKEFYLVLTNLQRDMPKQVKDKPHKDTTHTTEEQ